MTEVFVPTSINLTDRAVSKVKELIDGEGIQTFIYEFITGGGCSGFSTASVSMTSIKRTILRC